MFLDENSTSTTSGEFEVGGGFQTLSLSVYSASSVSVTVQCLLTDGSTTWMNVAVVASKTSLSASTITTNGIYNVDATGVDKFRVVNGNAAGSVQVFGVAIDFVGDSPVYGFPLSTLESPAWNTWINVTSPISSMSCVLPNPEPDVSSEIRFTFTTASTVSTSFFNFTEPTGYKVVGDYANPQILPNIVYQASLFSLDQSVLVNNVSYKLIGLIVYPWERVTAS